MEVLKVWTILILYLSINKIKCDPIKQSFKPCRINDQECLKNILKNVAKVWYPELDKEPFDPIVLKDIKLEYIGVATFVISEATLTGLSKSIYDLVLINLEFGNGTIIYRGNLTLSGTYEANVEQADLLGIPFNKTLTGKGTFNIDMNEIQLTENFNFYVIKDEKGVIRLRYADGELLYDVNKEGHDVKIEMTGCKLGEENIDASVNKYLSKNWRTLLSKLSPKFIEEQLKEIIASELIALFNMPANTFILNDLEAYVYETEEKTCLKSDIQCHLELIRRLKSNIPKSLSTDTRILKNLTMSLPELMDLTILEGDLKGIDACIIRNARFDFDNKKFVLNQLCDLVAKGNYTAVFHANATMAMFGGSSVKAEGSAELTLVKVPLNAEYKIGIVKESNNTYLILDELETSYDINEPGHKIVFKLDGIYLGTLDISEIAMNIMNENWDYFAPDFAPVFLYQLNKRINEPLVDEITSLQIKYMFSESID